MGDIPVNARSKAAAWAWYQRGSGLVSVRSEAASSGEVSSQHRSLVRGGCSPSRFKLEADLLLSGAPIDDASDRLESLHLSSGSTSCRSVDIVMMPARTSSLDSINLQMRASASDLLVVMSSSSYGTASWDCGSSLFDSFELIAMSKKLDDAHQLNQGIIEKVCPFTEEASTGALCETGSSFATKGAYKEEEEEEDEEEKRSTGLLPQSPMRIINNLCGLDADSDANGDLDCKQSRQAIYDMFCRYENLPTPGGSGCNDEYIKKHTSTTAMSPSARSGKQTYRRRRLHSLSKAFRHHFVQLTGQSRREASSTHHPHPPDEVRLQQSTSLPAKAASPHLHHKTTCVPESTTRAACANSEGGVCRQGPNHSLRKQYSSDDVDHYHHHHYHHHHHHYLFQHHSDDGFGPVLPVTPLLGADKSLLVAAAGLRTSKVSALQDYFLLNPKLDRVLLDSQKRRWGEYPNNHMVSPTQSTQSSPILQQ